MMVALIFGVFVLVLLIGCPIAIALLLGRHRADYGP